MNGNPAAQGQAPQGQQVPQQPQQARAPPFYRPDQMRALPEQFSAEEKKKWENGLNMLYKTMEDNPPETKAHQDARKKVGDFSMTLYKKIAQTLHQSGASQSQNSAQGQPAQTQGQAVPANSSQAAPTAGPASKPSEALLKHINSFPYVLPADIAQGTPEAQKWLSENKNKYGKALMTMESAQSQLNHLNTILKDRNEKGNPFNEKEQGDYKAKKESLQKTYSDAKRWSDLFRKTQETPAGAAAGTQNGAVPQQAPGTAVPPTRPVLNLQQQAPNAAQQNTETVNAAILNARYQQMNVPRPAPLNQPAPVSQPNDQMPQPGQNQPPPPQQIPHPQADQPGANIKVEGGNQPQINTAIATAPAIANAQRQNNNSPHTAGPPSATSLGPPRPLTHEAAVAHANRTYSNGQATGTPSVMAHSHPSISLPRETPHLTNTAKMPIPKNLPPSAIGPPNPISMQPSRPTLSGGPSNGMNSMGQPVLQKHPNFNAESEGERVMSKKKLDELVRQVTGGGDGLDSGEGLTPEVEDVSLFHLDRIRLHSAALTICRRFSRSPMSLLTRSSTLLASVPKLVEPRLLRSETSNLFLSVTTTSAFQAMPVMRFELFANSSQHRDGLPR
jgi:transcription initiation factor TFIID subunit 12